MKKEVTMNKKMTFVFLALLCVLMASYPINAFGNDELNNDEIQVDREVASNTDESEVEEATIENNETLVQPEEENTMDDESVSFVE